MINLQKNSLSYKAVTENPYEKVQKKVGEKFKIKINNITDKAIFAEMIDYGLSGMLHYKEISTKKTSKI